MINKIVLFCVFILMCFCQHRDNNNPFDPDYKEPLLDINLRLQEVDSSVRISWTIPEFPNYESAEIYKSANDNDFSLLIAAAKNINTVIDTDIIEEVRYTYFLKLIGKDIESKPTKNFSITTGPGDIWITDSYLDEVLKLNYDLENYSTRKSNIWRPSDIAIAKDIHKGLITYPQNKQIEIFDTRTGLTDHLNYSIPRPFDAIYDNDLNLFWLVDSSGSLYQVDTLANTTVISNQFIKPTQIELSANILIILDSKINTIILYNKLDDSTVHISQNHENEDFAKIKLIRLDKINKTLYILEDSGNNNNTVYKYLLETGTIEAFFSATLIQTFDIYSLDESIWIVTSNGLNFELVQLSNSGQRLLSVPETFFEPRDVKVNPYNGNVIITDFIRQEVINTDKVFHYKSTELVGSYKTYGDPFKVYIE